MTFLIFLALISIALQRQNVPIVLVPGLAGNQLYAKLSKKASNYWYCSKKNDEFLIWLKLTNMLPMSVNCFIENLTRDYDNQKKKFFDKKGVTIYPKNWGSVETFKYVDPYFKMKKTAYFQNIVQMLENHGYRDQVDMFGAPYDFRNGPINNPLKQHLISLIEMASKTNSNQKVHIISHSLGGKWMVEILKDVPQSWKDKYISKWISISPVYGGAVKALRYILSGGNEGIPYVNPLSMQPIFQTWESLFWILPHKELFQQDRILVEGDGKSFMTKHIDHLLRYRIPEQVMHMYYSHNAISHEDPNVPHYPLYALETKTEVRLSYPEECGLFLSKKEGFDCEPEKEYGSGDGTVERLSLESGNAWAKTVLLDDRVQPGETHNSMLQTEKTLELIQEILELKWE